MLVVAFICGCNDRSRELPPDEVERVVALLRSSNPRDVDAGVTEAAQMSRLPEDVTDQLIVQLGNRKYGHFLTNDTLVTSHNAVTRLLAQHPEAASSLRRALRETHDPQTRRFAAFALGEGCDDSSKGLLKELIVNALNEPFDQERAGTEGDPRAILNAAVDSYAKITPREAIQVLLPFTLHEERSSRQLACESLWRILRDTQGPRSCSPDAMYSGECGQLWMKWWSTNQARPDEELFRSAPCVLKRIGGRASDLQLHATQQPRRG